MFFPTRAIQTSKGGHVAIAYGRPHDEGSLSSTIPTTVYCGIHKATWYSESTRHTLERQKDQNPVPHHRGGKQKSISEVLELLREINSSSQDLQEPGASIAQMRSTQGIGDTFSTGEETISTVSTIQPVSTSRRTKSKTPLFLRSKANEEEARQEDDCKATRSKYDTREPPASEDNTFYTQQTTVKKLHQRKPFRDVVSNAQSKKITSTKNTSQDLHERLYNRSKAKQVSGRERREAIAQASLERRRIPRPEDFGKIPESRAGNMYDKGMAFLRTRQSRIRNKQRPIHAPSHSPAIPVSKATDLYDRGMDFLQTRASKFEKRRQGSDGAALPSAHLPLSNAGPLSTTNGNVRNMCATETVSMTCKLHSARRKKEDSSIIPFCKATGLYDRGINFLQTKALRLERRQREAALKLSLPLVLCTVYPSPIRPKGMLSESVAATRSNKERSFKSEVGFAQNYLPTDNTKERANLIKSHSSIRSTLSPPVNIKGHLSTPNAIYIDHIRKVCANNALFLKQLEELRKSSLLDKREKTRCLRINIFQESTQQGVNIEVVLHGPTNSYQKNRSERLRHRLHDLRGSSNVLTGTGNLDNSSVMCQDHPKNSNYSKWQDICVDSFLSNQDAKLHLREQVFCGLAIDFEMIKGIPFHDDLSIVGCMQI